LIGLVGPARAVVVGVVVVVDSLVVVLGSVVVLVVPSTLPEQATRVIPSATNQASLVRIRGTVSGSIP
jgi:hypothetical protein